MRSIHPADHPPDLVLLGLGDDGHTASLFPDTAALSADRRWYVANFVDKLDTWRLTATFPSCTPPAEIFFLVAGANKAERIAEIMEGAPIPGHRRGQGPSQVTWLLDEAAARLLSR